MRAPAWARNEPAKRTISKTQRLLILAMLQDLQVITEPDQKASIAKFFGISRWTVDRDLAALEKAQAQARLLMTTLFSLRLGENK